MTAGGSFGHPLARLLRAALSIEMRRKAILRRTVAGGRLRLKSF